MMNAEERQEAKWRKYAAENPACHSCKNETDDWMRENGMMTCKKCYIRENPSMRGRV